MLSKPAKQNSPAGDLSQPKKSALHQFLANTLKQRANGGPSHEEQMQPKKPMIVPLVKSQASLNQPAQ